MLAIRNHGPKLIPRFGKITTHFYKLKITVTAYYSIKFSSQNEYLINFSYTKVVTDKRNNKPRERRDANIVDF